jgi:chitinase
VRDIWVYAPELTSRSKDHSYRIPSYHYQPHTELCQCWQQLHGHQWLKPFLLSAAGVGQSDTSTSHDLTIRRADIAECQTTYKKTILLSIGGATYSEGGFTSSDAAVSAANNIWSIFGPQGSDSSVPRPFGASVIDGFDFDFESTVQNMPAFATQLRTLMDADTSKTYYLSAAPQCVYPDAADGPMLDGAVSFDFVWVQFYNNFCGLQNFVVGASSQTNFNFDTWDSWAKNTSSNKDVKVFLGIPANQGAAGSGYESGSTLSDIITYSKTFSSFGGVMMWDMSQLWANTGFLDAVTADLGGSSSSSAPTAPSKLRRGRRAPGQ